MRQAILFILLIVLAGFVANPAMADDDTYRAQISAAVTNAQTDLRNDISSARITADLTVGDFLQQTNGQDLMDEFLAMAQQIGGPRWIDEQTCQIKLEIPGDTIARSLITQAALRSRLSPIPAGEIEVRLRDWKDRTFDATGTSIAGSDVQNIQPIDGGPRWIAISDSARRQAVTDARQDAMQHLLDSIRPIRLSSGETVGDVLAKKDVQQKMNQWLASCPVTEVRFREDLQVELTVSAQADDVLKKFVSTANLPPGQTNMDDLRREFERRVSAAIGRAGVHEKPADDGQVTVQLPAEPPAWVGQPLDAEASATKIGNVLQTRNAAVTKATDNLRQRIESLQISEGLTVAQADHKNAKLADAVNRALLRAQLFNVDYRKDGSVAVRMTIDTTYLWSELQQAMGQ